MQNWPFSLKLNTLKQVAWAVQKCKVLSFFTLYSLSVIKHVWEMPGKQISWLLNESWVVFDCDYPS